MDRIGRYRIIGELGRGAMGVVYHATDPAIGRSVAIKVIRIAEIDDTVRRGDLRDRLFREARAAGVLSHPNIVTIYDMDEVDGLAYIAMAFVNGPTLARILASGGALSGTRMLRILRQTASALDYAHGRGIVHGDVKPANIMTDEDDAVKITDFGIAKITAGANLAGTLPDALSDQFSLAAVAYEIMTGERPFQDEKSNSDREVTSAHRINSTLTPQIDEVLRRGLTGNPEQRFPNCASFVGALEMACAESRGWTTARTGTTAAMPAPMAPLPLFPRFEPSARAVGEPLLPVPRRSRFVPVFLAVVGVLGIAAAVGLNDGRIMGLISPAGDRVSTPSTAPVTATTPSPEPEKPAETRQAAEAQTPRQSPFAPAAPETLKVPVPAPPPSRLQDLWVVTNPPDAKVVLDDYLTQACQTPCMLHSPGGVHHLTVSRAGYLNEYRELRVGDTAPEIPVIAMREPGGTLMLTTAPPGASIRINGQAIPQSTPAAIQLKPGNYSVTVEKDGQSQTQNVDVQENLVYVRIPLNQ